MDIKGTVGDNSDTSSIGMNNRQFVQYFGSIEKVDPDDLATLLSIALFGNDRLKFNGLISEVEDIKKQLRNVQESQEHRQEVETDIINRLQKLERNIPTLHYTITQKIFLTVVFISSVLIIYYVASQIL